MSEAYRKIQDWALNVTLFLCVIGLGTVFYWSFWPYKIIEVDQPMPVLNAPLTAGEVVEYKVQFCKFKNVPGDLVSEVIGEDVRGLAEVVDEEDITFITTFNEPEGCGQFVSKAIRLPDIIEPGHYHLRNTISYPVNPLRSVPMVFVTEEFEVR